MFGHLTYLSISIRRIVAYRPVARKRPRDKQIYNSRYLVMTSERSTFARQQLETAIEERCFLCGSCSDVISWTVSLKSTVARTEAGSNTYSVGGDEKGT
jgi:hypothetical protein